MNNNQQPIRPPLGQQRSLKHLSYQLQELVRGRLWLQILVGMAAGIGTGIAIGPSAGLMAPETAAIVSDWFAFPGRLFLALIQMIVIPLVFASIIRGLAASEDLSQLRHLGIRAGLYFVATTVLAIVIGLGVANIIKPGSYVDSSELQGIGTIVIPEPGTSNGPDLKDLPQKIVTLLPSNPLSSMVENNMVQVVIFAIIIGIALVMMPPPQARPLLELLESLQEVSMTIVRWSMRLAPFAVYGLMTQLTAKLGVDALLGMAVYVATVLLGLLIMFAVYLLLLALLTNCSIGFFLRSVREVLLLAFSTSSSAAVMPMSIKVAEDRLGVRSSVAQFIIPLGATINMNGTALYQGVAALFLAQVFGIDIGLGGMALIVVTAVGASIGSPATPGVGIVILSMVLSSVGIPPAGIALIIGVDRILDMSRTAINVCGDLVAARLVETWVKSPDTEPPNPQ